MVTTRSLPSTLLAVTAAIAITAAAGAARAEEDPRSVEARKACAVGDVDKGIRLLADYLAAVDDAAIVYNMGRCYEQNGVVDKAVLRFQEYLRKATDLSPEDRTEAEEHIRQLQAEQTRRDRGARPPAEDRARSGGGGLVLRRLGLAAGALGLAGLGAGAVFALRVKSVNDDLAAQRTRPDPDGAHFVQRMEDGRRAERLEWIALGAGAAALVTGSVLYFLGWTPGTERSVTAALGPTGGTLRMTF